MVVYNAVAYVSLVAILLVATVLDIRTHQVPAWLTYLSAVAGILFWTIVGAATGETLAGGAWQGFSSSGFGLLAALIPFAIIYALGALGGGDVKLMAVVGAMSAHWECVLGTALYGFITGLVMAVIVMISKGVVRRTFHRIFGVLLALAARTKPVIPEDSPRIPFALAILVGGAVSGAEVLLGMKWR